MKTLNILFALLIAGILFISACTELKKNLPLSSTVTAKIHGTGWVDGSSQNFHGKYLKQRNYDETDCYQCHGKNLTGGSSGVSCFKCHENYPHKSAWVEADSSDFHGKYLKSHDNQTNLCTPCHGSDLRGGTSGVSCVACHSTYPHPGGWTKTDSVSFHGKFLKTNEYRLSICSSCHGSDFLGGSSGVTCYECHQNYPHFTGWTKTDSVSFHGKYLEDHGNQTSLCTPCHGPDLSGGTSGVSCFSCHANYPHSEGWSSTDSVSFHGKYLKTNNYQFTQCSSCHGVDFLGGSSGVSCYQCHDNFPHFTGWITEDSIRFHGKYLKTHGNQTSLCTSCHGTDLGGGTSGVSCYSCHANYPHPGGWTAADSLSFHGKFLKTNDYQVNLCSSCHGADFLGGSSGISCFSCHSTFPHKGGWTNEESPDFHGGYLAAHQNQTSLCAPCHGTDLRGGTSGTSCYSCHTNYPHQSGWNSTPSSDFHGKYLKANSYNLSSCSDCHGSDYLGGGSGISCFSCHTSFPHTTGWNADTSAVGFHGKYLKPKDWVTTECKSCHGSSYSGGTSDKACFTCHASFPHEAKFTGGDDHESYMENNNYPIAECKTCHGAGMTGGARVKVSCSSSGCHTDMASNAKSPEACNTCHGNFRGTATDVNTWAPPKSVVGDTATIFRGVGAHQKHIASGVIGKTVKCQECHTIPGDMYATGHIDNPSNVTVAFNDTLARLATADGNYTPVYQTSALTCDNTFCHGNWKMRKSASSYQYAYADSVITGSKFSPLWTGGSVQGACGTTCHTLPPVGHFATAITACATCHQGVVDNTGSITDRNKHINGKIDFLGAERSFPQ